MKMGNIKNRHPEERSDEGSRSFGPLALRMTIYSLLSIYLCGCTVKAVGDPNRPITINANVVVDIRGLKKTAVGIEDMVAQGAQGAQGAKP